MMNLERRNFKIPWYNSVSNSISDCDFVILNPAGQEVQVAAPPGMVPQLITRYRPSDPTTPGVCAATVCNAGRCNFIHTYVPSLAQYLEMH